MLGKIIAWEKLGLPLRKTKQIMEGNLIVSVLLFGVALTFNLPQSLPQTSSARIRIRFFDA